MAAEEYGRIRAELKAKGRPIPGTDAQIAAVARLHDLTVLSTDHHFQYVDNLRVESWL
jgi:tRNA(fMet)-specific endonuclease VapC